MGLPDGNHHRIGGRQLGRNDRPGVTAIAARQESQACTHSLVPTTTLNAARNRGPLCLFPPQQEPSTKAAQTEKPATAAGSGRASSASAGTDRRLVGRDHSTAPQHAQAMVPSIEAARSSFGNSPNPNRAGSLPNRP